MIRQNYLTSRFALVFAASIPLLSGNSLGAGPSPAQKCEAAKIKAAARKQSCVAASQARQALGGVTDTSRCTVAFNRAFSSAETTYGVSCPTTGDAGAIEQRVDAAQAGTVQFLSGAGRSRDNGDGTITDADTGLMWEKKSSDGSLHDQSINGWSWSVSGSAPDGTLFTAFLAGLNAGSGFAGHTDWRIPTIYELESIFDYGTSDPAVSAAFNSGCVQSCPVTTCSCTATGNGGGYWSSTVVNISGAAFPNSVWIGVFVDGSLNTEVKTANFYARAVRRAL
jgi:hypothetical protein